VLAGLGGASTTRTEEAGRLELVETLPLCHRLNLTSVRDYGERLRDSIDAMIRASARVLIGSLLVLSTLPVHANDSGPVSPPPRWSAPPVRSAPAGKTAEDRYNEGRGFTQSKQWGAAEDSYREAVRLRASFPEAWNGLGYALRHQKKYEESVRAYEEALRQRPNYAEALEYLGEAYVQMGKLEEARAVLDRLRPLDPKEAETLAQAISSATSKR
jgi:tetratricopeptide (TPR) repeat protein